MSKYGAGFKIVFNWFDFAIFKVCLVTSKGNSKPVRQIDEFYNKYHLKPNF